MTSTVVDLSTAADDGDDDATDFPEPAFLDVTLSDPTTVGSGMAKHTNYTLTVRSSFEFYKAHEFSVVRRYNDFVRLSKVMRTKYHDVVMPALPPPKVSGRFSEKVVRERMSALEDFTNWVALHPIMRHDRVVHCFLQLPQDQLQASLLQSEEGSTGAGAGGSKRGSSLNRITQRSVSAGDMRSASAVRAK